jgi:hypothetical protein
MRFKPHQAEGKKILKVLQNLSPVASVRRDQLSRHVSQARLLP